MGLSVPGRESSTSKYSVSKKNLVLKTSILSFSDVNLSLCLPQPSLVDRELGVPKFCSHRWPEVALASRSCDL